MKISEYESESDEFTCKSSKFLQESTFPKGNCSAYTDFFASGGDTDMITYIEAVTIDGVEETITAEQAAAAISAIAAVAIVGSAAGAASSAAGASGGSGGTGPGTGPSAGGQASGNLTSIWLLVCQLQFISLISTMGSKTLKAFGSSLSWANLYSAIDGVASECDNTDAEERATGGILVFFVVLLPILLCHLALLSSIHAYVRVKAAHVTFNTPTSLQFPRIELRLLLIALAGQTYAYSRLAACGKDGGTVFGGVVLLLMFPIPMLIAIYHILSKLQLTEAHVTYAPDESMQYEKVKDAVTPVGQKMLTNIKQLQSPEANITRYRILLVLLVISCLIFVAKL